MEAILERSPDLAIEYTGWQMDIRAGSFWDLTALTAIAKARNPRVCFEIGTGHGRTTLALARNTPPETSIYSLDLSTADHTGSVFRGCPEEAKITRLMADSTNFDFSPWKGRVDMVFVDGSHEYEAVKHDTKVAFELVAKNGVILWDDFAPGWYGVVKAIRESPRRASINYIWGTKLAYYENCGVQNG